MLSCAPRAAAGPILTEVRSRTPLRAFEDDAPDPPGAKQGLFPADYIQRERLTETWRSVLRGVTWRVRLIVRIRLPIG